MSRQSFKNIFRLLDSVDDDTTPEQSFLSDLKRSIEMTADSEDRAPSKTYKPSSMQCIRNMYYQVTGHARDPQRSNFALVGICNSGTDTHERVQKYVANMKTYGIDCEYVDVAEYVKQRNLDYIDVVSQQGMETKLYHKPLNISFLCDGIIRYKGKYYILELKTETSFKWQSRNGVDPKHYAQGTAYSLIFHIDNVIFVYINRDILDMKAYMFTPTDEMKTELVDKISECDNYVQSEKVPPKPADVPKSACEYCAYRSSCRAEGDGV